MVVQTHLPVILIHLATCDDGSCLTTYGCTDSLATNYDPLATCEDSSCVYGYYVTFQLDLRGSYKHYLHNT